jgi:hypothetical protein
MKPIHALCFVVVVGVALCCPRVQAQGAGQADPSAAEINKALDTQRINFSFEENMPLRRVVRQLRTLCRVNILYYPIPEEDIPINVDLKDTTLRQALDTICKAGKHDLDFDIIQGAVVVADKPTLFILRNKKAALPPNPGPDEAETLKKLDDKVDFRFEDTKMQEACEFLAGLAKVNIVSTLPREGENFPKVTLMMSRVTLGQALFHLTGLKFNYGVFGPQIVVSDNVGLALRKVK